MDRWTNNTLRTLGIIVVSIIVIGVSLFLTLLALCLGAFNASPSYRNSSDVQAFYLCIFGIVALISGGVFIIAKLAKGISRNIPEYPFPMSVVPDTAVAPAQVPQPEPVPPIPPSQPAPVSSTPPPLSPRAPIFPTPVSPPPSVSSAPVPPHPVSARAVAAHFSPASRTAINQLALAIAAKLAAETVISLIGWTYTYQVRNFPNPTMRYSFIAWGLGAVAPLLVLLYSLLRYPGPRAFAYSLVIPSMQLFFGLFGHTATIFVLFRSQYLGVPPVLSLFALAPWLLDFLVLYLALKVIRLTGIRPNSTRLIVASAVMFFYTSFLPVIVFITNSYLASGRR